jgi:hypothetical protein
MLTGSRSAGQRKEIAAVGSGIGREPQILFEYKSIFLKPVVEFTLCVIIIVITSGSTL